MMSFDSIGSPFVNETGGACNPGGAEDNRPMGVGDPASPEGANVDAPSRDLFFNVVNAYAEAPWEAQYGSNGDNDHLSWIEHSYPAGGGVESNIAANGLNLCGFELQRHNTERDTIDGVSEPYLRQWGLSVLGYLLEIALLPEPSAVPTFVQPICPLPTPRPRPPPPPPPSPIELPTKVRLVSSVGSPPTPQPLDLFSSSGASAVTAGVVAAFAALVLLM
eukprot:TRINITY_DN11797_c0_g1_i1.p1 TRINITY_DN11797_c0_g1~~TRINITY_DN11797_c0_g1_i1.p1  ORF type:complete len:220 (-),score=68.48 TRINITY_DN11797_c0_g1_i1:84-743(-)